MERVYQAADVLASHYDTARTVVHQTSNQTAHEGYHDRERRARQDGDDATAGREGACADACAREWERALGAAAAI